MMAMSKLDLALWDLKGRLADEPVWRLLGGPTRPRVPAYASMLGYDQEPERAAAETRRVVAAGYGAIKWFFRNGPGEREAGFAENVELVRRVREAAGPATKIMFDAWNGWDVEYCLRTIAATAGYDPYWIEEPVMPDAVGGYAKIREGKAGVGGATVNIAGGEHEYTRWGARRLLDAGAIDVLQPDPTWCGGITEITKICSIASTYHVPVIPHHGGYASLHLIASRSPAVCPLQEWLFQAGRRDNVFQAHPIEPVDGAFALPEAPGLGIEIDEDKADTIEPIEELQGE
jgi:L-alanine-DL-glutamate epimerase-like enolase superfamily enzyme